VRRPHHPRARAVQQNRHKQHRRRHVCRRRHFYSKQVTNLLRSI
jgi:hypothetical protein